MPYVECQICQKEFYIKPSHQKLGWGKFCSRTCHTLSQRKGHFVSCKTCGKQIWRMPKSLERSKSGYFFCNKSCSLSWKNTILNSGINHPLWNGGESSYRKKKEDSSEDIYCLHCGLRDKRVLVVHHIDENRKNNILTNLMWLCRNCHYLIHNGKTI